MFTKPVHEADLNRAQDDFKVDGKKEFKSIFHTSRSIYGMKYRFIAGILFLLVLAASCQDRPIRASYGVILPKLPGHWEEILPDAHWRLQWIDDGGIWLEKDIPPGGEGPDLSLVEEWTTAVLAWPFWPERDLIPGMMRPAGALFPWDADVSDGKLTLSWESGVEAVFWKEIAGAERTTTAAGGRLPWYFDWPRFRELLYESDIVPGPVRRDPWIADWESIAVKTVQSGFDRRRIVSQKFTVLSIPGPGGRWISSSPFAPPLDFPPDGPLYLNVVQTPDIWVSSGAILKCSTSGWVLKR